MDEETLSPEEQKERKIMKLLLKIKNGTPPMRKVRVFSYNLCPISIASRMLVIMLEAINKGEITVQSNDLSILYVLILPSVFNPEILLTGSECPYPE